MSKKSKTGRNSFMVILIVVLIFLVSWILYDEYKTEPADTNIESSNLADENTGLDNIINDLFEEVTTNTTEESKTKNEENEIEEDEDTETQEAPTGTVTSREERAVELVKQAWGEDDSVYFSYQSINNAGKYIVTVNKKDTTVIAWFEVDVDNELVTKK